VEKSGCPKGLSSAKEMMAGHSWTLNEDQIAQQNDLFS
jgi:hypothetical protein